MHGEASLLALKLVELEVKKETDFATILPHLTEEPNAQDHLINHETVILTHVQVC